ncbi:MAG: AMP-dependent synthetase/ligase [Alkalispirochaetaceae bacterium]
MAPTLLSMLADAAERYTERPYLSVRADDGWHAHSFAEVRKEAIAVAAALRAEGVETGSKGAILAEGSPEWIIAEFALFYAGCVSVPLSTRLLSEEVPYRINHSHATIMFLSAATVGAVESVLEELETDELLLVVLDESPGAVKRLAEATRGYDGYRTTTLSKLLEGGSRSSRAKLREVEERESSLEPDEPAVISYTSGTSGAPKGVMLSHRNFYVNSRDAVEMYEVPDRFATFLMLPCDHALVHTTGIFAALLRGISLHFARRRTGGHGLRRMPDGLKEAGASYLITVPALTGSFMKWLRRSVEQRGSVLRRIFERGVAAGVRRYGDGYRRPGFFVRLATAPPYLLAERVIFRSLRAAFGGRLEFCVGGGAILDKGQEEFFCALGVPIYQGYGLTEAAPVVAANTPKAHKFGTSGRVAPSLECRILRETGEPADRGERGEIVIRGESVMQGYYKDEEATAAAIQEGWLHTGDLGYIDSDDFLVVVGRKEALLVSETGESFSPEEIEEALVLSSPLVDQILLHNDRRPYTTALIVPNQAEVGRFLKESRGATPRDVLDLYSKAIISFGRRPETKEKYAEPWLPRTFQLLEEPFTAENRMINSTSKVVRHRVASTYQDLLDYMYTDEGSEYPNRRNKETVKRLFFV